MKDDFDMIAIKIFLVVVMACMAVGMAAIVTKLWMAVLS